MSIKEISTSDLSTVISSSNSTLLCGNGLSINFDSGYSVTNLGSRLFTTHNYVINNWDYDVLANKHYKSVLEGNLLAVRPFLLLLNTESRFTNLFNSAVAFAQSITRNNVVVDWLNGNGFNQSLTFGLSPLDFVNSIVEQAKANGVLNVNYEYWTILIYYYIALSSAPTTIYRHNPRNPFSNLVELGQSNLLYSEINGANVYSHVSANGFFIYLRFLFSANILLDGKSYFVKTLTNWDYCDKAKLQGFLSKFQNLITTNYDQILEEVSGSKIDHLHGAYSLSTQRVMSQSLGVIYNKTRYDISTIVIGDYFLSKSFLQVTSKFSAKQPQNTNIEIYTDILHRVLVEQKSSTVVIFGLNIDNDFHIIRDIQIYLERSGASTPNIVYCYYSDLDKSGFVTTYDQCITYSADLSDFVKNRINVYTCDSKALLREIL